MKWRTLSVPAVPDRPGKVPVLPCHVGDPRSWFADTPAGLRGSKTLCVSCDQAAVAIRRFQQAEPWGVGVVRYSTKIDHVSLSVHARTRPRKVLLHSPRWCARRRKPLRRRSRRAQRQDPALRQGLDRFYARPAGIGSRPPDATRIPESRAGGGSIWRAVLSARAVDPD